jgi:hypothetical protein
MGKVYVRSGDQPDTSHNIHYATQAWFKNVLFGDLHLTATSEAQAVDKGRPLPDVILDFDGCIRVDNPDVGADEYSLNGCIQAGIGEYASNGSAVKPGFKIFPNPFRTSIEISGVHSGDISIYDLSGKLIDKIATRNPYVWHAQDHPAGSYIITVQSADKQLTRRALLLK